MSFQVLSQSCPIHCQLNKLLPNLWKYDLTLITEDSSACPKDGHFAGGCYGLFVSTTVASESHPAQFFKVVGFLLAYKSKSVSYINLATNWDFLQGSLAIKSFPSGRRCQKDTQVLLTSQTGWERFYHQRTLQNPVCPCVTSGFRLILPLDVDRILGSVTVTTCTLDCFLSGFWKHVRKRYWNHWLLMPCWLRELFLHLWRK